VWVGFGVTSIYGIWGQAVVDCSFATLYLATSAALFVKERLGIGLAFAIALISSATLVLTDLPFLVDPKTRVSSLQFVVTTTAAVGYSVLAYILGKAQMQLWRSASHDAASSPLDTQGEVARNSPKKAGFVPRLNPPLRFVLMALFGSCGIWLPCYSIALLNTSRGAIPTACAWAWSDPVMFVFYRIAPGVWLGLSVGAIYGAVGQVTADCVFAAFYLATAATLLFKEQVGAGLAFAISLVSAVMLALEILGFVMDRAARGYTLSFAAFMTALVGFSILTYILGKTQVVLWRSRSTQTI